MVKDVQFYQPTIEEATDIFYDQDFMSGLREEEPYEEERYDYIEEEIDNNFLNQADMERDRERNEAALKKLNRKKQRTRILIFTLTVALIITVFINIILPLAQLMIAVGIGLFALVLISISMDKRKDRDKAGLGHTEVREISQLISTITRIR